MIKGTYFRTHFLHINSWKNACWGTTGPLYAAVAALHLWPQSEWEANRVVLLRHLLALAHARATTAASDGGARPEEPSFAVYKPYLLFFGLIQALYEYFFKVGASPLLYFPLQFLLCLLCPFAFNLSQGVKVSINDEPAATGSSGASSSCPWWPAAMSRYIRSSDEQLLAATPKLLSFFEEDLSPIESIDEFLDVVGMIGVVDSQELERLINTGSS